MLKRALRKIVRGQKGQVLPIVLILLIIGGLLIVPTLRYASTSLKTHQVTERKAEELYAADSGVEYALIKLSKGETTLADYQLNGKTVSVTITDMGDGSYLITSTATSADGSSTTIHTGVSSSGGFAYLLDNAITSDGDVTIKGDVVGNVTASGTVDGEENVTGTVTEGATIDNWPSAEDFSTYYGADVDKDNPYPSDFIDLDGVPTSIGPLYVDGDLSIYNSSNTEATLTLTGTLYIVGKAEIGKSPKDFTLDLNGNTIYIESNLTGGGASGTALWIGENCEIVGSGCIIAIGDIYFAPKGDVGSGSDFVFVMSVTGTTTLNPGGSFFGSIAGAADVTLQPGCYLEWNSLGGEGNLNFPSDVGVVGGSTEDMTLGGWDIS